MFAFQNKCRSQSHLKSICKTEELLNFKYFFSILSLNKSHQSLKKAELIRHWTDYLGLHFIFCNSYDFKPVRKLYELILPLTSVLQPS